MQELRPETQHAPGTREHKHLIVMANGLFGKASNWDVVIENLQQVLDVSQVLLVASNANSLLQTYDGIDSCGDRLALEIEQKVKECSSLDKISLLGHSMGGLLVRYAAGKLYDPKTRLICGLKPAHFLTMATPHMGCDGEGPAQVPFIGWTGEVPLAGRSVQRLLQAVAKPFVSTFMRRTGRQFFMQDGQDGRQPLLVRMSQDSETDGHFMAALDSFVTRTCYANAAGDHLVGWANSSIRHPDELPVIDPKAQLRGVIREDPPEACLHPHHAQLYLQHHRHDNALSTAEDAPASQSGSGLQTGLQRDEVGRSPLQQVSVLHEAQASASEQHQHDRGTASSSQQQNQNQLQDAEATVSSSSNALQVLKQLQKLPWRRIDVSFQHARMSFFAHNNIQVTRRWLNWEGAAVCQHLACQLAFMEKDECIQQLIAERNLSLQ